jgi:uncharacterized RDD family membrane protein YckC
MFCSACGANIEAGTRFCQKCGAPAESASPAAYAAQPGTSGPVYAAAPAAGGAAIAAAVPAARRTPYAGFWLRFVAYIVDGLIIQIPLSIIFWILFLAFGGINMLHTMISTTASMQSTTNPNEALTSVLTILTPIISIILLLVLAQIAASWLYFAYMESSARQATLGKGILNLKVTDMNGNRISFGRASGRFFGKIVTNLVPLFIGWILAGFTEKKQALHDFIAGTLVWRAN